MPGDWLKVGGALPTIKTRTVYVERLSLVSLRPRRAALTELEHEIKRQGHTFVAGTLRFQRNRNFFTGRFERGWRVSAGVIRDGRRIGLGEALALQNPRGPLNYYELGGDDGRNTGERVG